MAAWKPYEPIIAVKLQHAAKSNRRAAGRSFLRSAVWLLLDSGYSAADGKVTGIDLSLGEPIRTLQIRKA